jgi:two-component system response regulator MprA
VRRSSGRCISTAYEAWRGERQVQLTRTEWLLLERFLRHPRQVLSRAVIFDRVTQGGP